jgi:hypothetical protein
LGYIGLQIPTWDTRAIDLEKASISKNYCDEYKGKLNEIGLEVVELASYLQEQAMGMLGIPPVYEKLFQAFYPKNLNDSQRVVWATDQLKKTVLASKNMGTKHISVLSGGLAWQFFLSLASAFGGTN